MNNKTVLLTALCTFLMHFRATAMLAPRAMHLHNGARIALTHKTAFNGVQQTAMQMRNLCSKCKQQSARAISDLDKQNRKGETVLHRAIARADYQEAEQLLLHGANPNIQDKYGETALHYAVAQSDLKSIILLLNHKADPNIRNSEFETPLHLAVQDTDTEIRPFIICTLLKRGALTYLEDSYGYTPQDYSSQELEDFVMQNFEQENNE